MVCILPISHRPNRALENGKDGNKESRDHESGICRLKRKGYITVSNKRPHGFLISDPSLRILLCTRLRSLRRGASSCHIAGRSFPPPTLCALVRRGRGRPGLLYRIVGNESASGRGLANQRNIEVIHGKLAWAPFGCIAVFGERQITGNVWCSKMDAVARQLEAVAAYA